MTENTPSAPGRSGRDRNDRPWQRWIAWLADTGPDTAGRLPRFFLLFLLLFGCGMILISLIGDQGLIAYYGLRAEAERLRTEVTELEARRERLHRELEHLRSDPETIAHLARKRLGLVQSAERVLELRVREEQP